MVARVSLLLALVATLALAPPALAAFPGGNGEVVHGWSLRDEPELTPSFRFEQAIRAIAPTGGTPRTVRGCVLSEGGPLEGDCAIDYLDPAVSRNGRRVVFDAGASLALIAIDGSRFRLLPGHSEDDGEPAFSPTGTHVAFSAGPSDPAMADARGICVRDLSAPGEAVACVPSPGLDPAWSTRSRIAFVRLGEIWTCTPSGRDLRRLTRTRAANSAPAWSPHGTKLAFVRRGSIFVRNVLTGRTQRAVRGAGAVDLAWSPDGRRFLVSTFEGSVYTIRTDGRFPRHLVTGGVNATMSFGAAGVDWQPLR